jgi:putative DNA methylase
MTLDDIRAEGMARRLGAQMTAVVVDGLNGKEYRLPTEDEVRLAFESEKALGRVFGEIPLGLPAEPINTGSICKGGLNYPVRVSLLE